MLCFFVEGIFKQNMQLKYQDKISCSADVVFPCGEYSEVEHANLQHFACRNY